VTDAPLIPGSLYGLRTWRIGRDADGENLLAVSRDTPWPGGGSWFEASCAAEGGHAAPAPDCTCGVHAWHPRRSSARRVLAGRFEQPGVVEAAGAIELQHDGFRAQRARPSALVVIPGRNTKRAERLARRYDAELVRVADADALLAWCADRGVGLDAPTVDELLGPENACARLRSRRRKRRAGALRIAVAVMLSAAAVAAGWAFASGPPSSGRICGRTGCFKVGCPKPKVPDASTARAKQQARAASKRC
jgi:hypothetical protein